MVELGRVLQEVGEVRVFESDLEAAGHLASTGDVPLRQLVADASRTRVEHHPHRSVGVIDADLHEVVARAERAQLIVSLAGLLVVELGTRAVVPQPLGRGHRATLRTRIRVTTGVAPAHAGRNGPPELAQEGIEVIGQVGLGEVGHGVGEPLGVFGALRFAKRSMIALPFFNVATVSSVFFAVFSSAPLPPRWAC